MTRQELYDLLWPDGQVDVDRGLNTLIRQIRKAIGDDASTPRWIRTYPRRGYRLLVAQPLDPALERSPSQRASAIHIGVALGLAAAVAVVLQWNWLEAERRVRLATSINPNHVEYHAGLAFVLVTAGRRSEALDELETARQLHPINALLKADLGQMFFYAGDMRRAAEACEQAVTLAPEAAYARECALEAWAALGDDDATDRHLSALLTLWKIDDAVVPKTGVPSRLEWFRQWRADRLVTPPGRLSPYPFLTALALVDAGRDGAAIAALRQTAAHRSLGFVTVTTDPRFARLYADPDFRRLVAPLVAGGAAPPTA